jgi:hypothetical protein
VAPPAAPTTDKPDVAQMRARLRPLLRSAQTCVPRADLLPPKDMLELALDSFDGHLVVCAQVTSAAFDAVSYACWNVDPRSGAVARRGDTGRAYFRCQDGAAEQGCGRSVVDYAGTRLVTFDNRHTLAIALRDGTRVRSIPSLPSLAPELQRGIMTYVGDLLFIVVDDGPDSPGATIVLDDRGHAIGRARGTDVEVIDGGHVMIIDESDQATVYDVATRAHRTVAVPVAFTHDAVGLGGALYALDGRELVTLDPRTFAPRGRVALATCP